VTGKSDKSEYGVKKAYISALINEVPNDSDNHA
jgi:hypothetical protein